MFAMSPKELSVEKMFPERLFRGGFRVISKFVLERMENKKYAFFSKIHKIRSLIDMDLIFFLNVRHILVDS